MERYQSWKWYDTVLIGILIMGFLICIIIIKDIITSIACLLLIAIVVSFFKKEINIAIAEKMIKKGKPEKALEYCDKVLKKDPNYIYALIKKGEIFESINNPKKALEFYNSAISKDPNNNIPWEKKGELLKSIGEDEKALEAFNKAENLKNKKIEKKLYYRIMKKIVKR
ncbi:tetratricopeptide repeat protein [Methanobrevibacter sp.]|uniref:tetratricopeptide repeat protein n=1 Tax=Methanobrevibacter sp. TaxID=66852 RepID=UPI002604EC7D|nr:tetratricopeptide repeat protein [uncultured Methanobrevibacter sp.]